MKLQEIAKTIDGNVITSVNNGSINYEMAFASDLMSDVLTLINDNLVLITGLATLQTHKNVMAIASLKDLAAVILVKGLVPEEDTSAQSDLEGIPVLGSGQQTFEVAGKLYELINK